MFSCRFAHCLRPAKLLFIPVTAGLFICLRPSTNNTLPIRGGITRPTIFSPSEIDHSLPCQCRITHFIRDKIWEPILTAKRFVHLLVLFLPVILSTPMLLIGNRWGAVWWYGLLVKQMVTAGPTFIKLAQWAATRVDIFPTVMCEKLGTLHSHGTLHPLDHTKRVIEDVFQCPFNAIFDQFEETPIGAGAIAQVYCATLKKDLLPPSVILQHPPLSVPTTAVAIKVLHPKVEKMISRDLCIMSLFAHCISLLPGMQWISLPEEVESFGHLMSQQLDLRHEANNLETFEHNFMHRRVPVTYPRPLKIWSTKDLLIEEYMNALSMEYFLANGAGPFDEQLATIGLDAFLHMLLMDNFVHSDLHPGNIMVKFSKPPSTRVYLESLCHHFFHSINRRSTDLNWPDSDSIVDKLRQLRHLPKDWLAELQSLHQAGYMPEVVFIDAGLVTTLNPKNRKNFIDLFRALTKFDGYHVGQLMIERSCSPELAIDPETFALKMQHLVLGIKQKTFSLGQFKLSDLLIEALKAVRHHHVKMEGDFINTVIAILLLEGIGRQLDPKLDLFASSLPILRQLGGTMATRENLKVWVWIEARSLISAAIVNPDGLVKYNWLCPSI